MPLVQSAYVQLPAGITAGKLVLPAPITPGNLVVFVATILSADTDVSDMTFGWEGGAPLDLDGGLWEQGAFPGGGGMVMLAGQYATFTSTGLHTVEITTASQSISMVVFEWAGVESSPLDQTVAPGGTGTGTAAQSGLTGTLATDSSLVVGVSAQYSGAVVGVTIPADHTSIVSLADPTISPPLYVTAQHVITTSAQNLLFTYHSSVLWITGVAVFKLEPGWQPDPPPDYPVARGGSSA